MAESVAAPNPAPESAAVRHWGPGLALVGIAVAHLALAARWLSIQELPMGLRDEFFIVEVAVDIALALAGETNAALLPLIQDAYYPPLCRAPGVTALLFGANYDGMVVAQWIWVPLLVVGTYRSARFVAGPWPSVAAVGLLLAGPGVYDTLHRFEPNLAILSLGAGGLWAWLASHRLRDMRASLYLGLCLALALLSDRLGLAPVVVAPLVGALLLARRQALRGLLGGALVVALVAGWWYAGFAGRFLEELLPQLTGGEIGAVGQTLEERPPLLFFWLHYLLIWVDGQLGLVSGLFALAGLGWALRRQALRIRKRPVPNETSDSGRAEADILLWLLGGLLLFSLVQKRQPFYTLPLLPAACVLAAAWLQRMAVALSRPRWIAPSIVAGAVALASWPHLVTAGGVAPDLPLGLRSWTLLGRSPLPEAWIGERFLLGDPPQDLGLNLEEILDDLAEQGLSHKEPLLLFSDDPQIAESHLVSLARIHRWSGSALGMTLHPDAVLENGAGAGALVYVQESRETRGALGEIWPDAAQLSAAQGRYFGGEADPKLLEILLQHRERSQHVGVRQLGNGAVVSSWRLRPGESNK